MCYGGQEEVKSVRIVGALGIVCHKETADKGGSNPVGISFNHM